MSIGYPPSGSYACPKCGQWVYPHSVHFCSTPSVPPVTPQPFPWVTPITWTNPQPSAWVTAIPCVKCGSRDINVRHHASKQACGYGSGFKADGEHLHLTCSCCQWQWATPTLDAEPTS